MAKNKNAIKLTKITLQELKDRGYQYVLVKGYTLDRRLDYIQMNHFTLLPVVELPSEPGAKEIFAPVDSEVLVEWANATDTGLEVYIEYEAPS